MCRARSSGTAQICPSSSSGQSCYSFGHPCPLTTFLSWVGRLVVPICLWPRSFGPSVELCIDHCDRCCTTTDCLQFLHPSYHILLHIGSIDHFDHPNLPVTCSEDYWRPSLPTQLNNLQSGHNANSASSWAFALSSIRSSAAPLDVWRYFFHQSCDESSQERDCRQCRGRQSYLIERFFAESSLSTTLIGHFLWSFWATVGALDVCDCFPPRSFRGAASKSRERRWRSCGISWIRKILMKPSFYSAAIIWPR